MPSLLLPTISAIRKQPKISVLVGAAILAAGCSAQQSPSANESATRPVETTHPGSQIQTPAPTQMRAYIDPATGKLRDPTPEDLAAEAALDAAKKSAASSSTRKTSEPREIVLPNGAIAVELDESAQQPLIACTQKNGDIKMEHECEAKTGEAK